MGITQCILKKKKQKNKKKKHLKNDLVIYSLNCKSMVKQPHFSTFFQIYFHNAVPEVAKPRITQPISKKTFTNNTSTSRFIIIYQIPDILGKYLENNARQNYGSAHFTFIH